MARLWVSAFARLISMTPRPASVMVMPEPTVLTMREVPPRLSRTWNVIDQPVMSRGWANRPTRVRSCERTNSSVCSADMRLVRQGDFQDVHESQVEAGAILGDQADAGSIAI